MGLLYLLIRKVEMRQVKKENARILLSTNLLTAG
jgi:hypothetical protein